MSAKKTARRSPASKKTTRPELNTCRAGCCRGTQDAVVLDVHCEATNDVDARESLQRAAYCIAYGQGATEENVDALAEVALTMLDAVATTVVKRAVRDAGSAPKAA